MMGVIGIIALLTVLGLSLVITRIATVALMMTGLSAEVFSDSSESGGGCGRSYRSRECS